MTASLTATRYGHCPTCRGWKYLTAAGLVWPHNGYQALAGRVIARRCTGSDQPPTEHHAQEATTT